MVGETDEVSGTAVGGRVDKGVGGGVGNNDGVTCCTVGPLVGVAVGKADGVLVTNVGCGVLKGVGRGFGNDDGVPCCTVGISVGVAVGKVEVGLGVKKNIF